MRNVVRRSGRSPRRRWSIRNPPDQQRTYRDEGVEGWDALHPFGEPPIVVLALVIGEAAKAVDQQDRRGRAEPLPHHDSRRCAVQKLVAKIENVRR